MVGLARSRFYKHIKIKGISIDNADTKRPTIDISELIRVYGDKVKTPEKLAAEKERRRLTANTQPDDPIEEKLELLTLREKLKHSEELRRTEKAAAHEQIELLKSILDSEKDERRRTTALLTDQRSEKERQAEQLASLQKEIATIKGAGFFKRLFGFGREI
jgi:hypothetical protein